MIIAEPRRSELFALANPTWKATWLPFDRGEFCRTRDSLLASVARRRGCGSPHEISRFYSESGDFPRPLAGMPVYHAARDRVQRALFRGEKIALFSDYDCDGISSLVILFEFLRGRGASTGLFVPDRMKDGYGLTRASAMACVERHHPALLIALDCGTTSVEAVAWLKANDVDVIIIDHHKADDVEPLAVSLLNPKSLGDFAGELSGMTAAGLAFAFADQLAADFHFDGWDRERAAVIAGIGTYVDVAPLDGFNRALVKTAMARLNREGWLAEYPGLNALVRGLGLKRFDEFALGFGIGPLFNAPGRIGHASDVVRCLVATDDGAAGERAAGILETNERRRELQERVRRSAERKAEQMMGVSTPPKVLLIVGDDYHPGVVGIVASRIREKFNRPAVICAPAEDGTLAGSGRSCAGFSLGGVVLNAVRQGVVLGGGGHDMAAGVRLRRDQAPEFDLFLQQAAESWTVPTGMAFELLGVADSKPAAEWLKTLHLLGPFGMGNPRPKLVVERAVVTNCVYALRRKGSDEVWAIRAMVETDRGRRMMVTWPDPIAAGTILKQGNVVQLIVDLYEGEDRSPAHAEWMIAVGCLRA